MVKIYTLQKTTLQDFPKHIACIVFLSGCNFKCTFCHNPAAVYNSEPNMLEEDFFKFLESRKGKLDGVVITGGEPTIYGEKLIEFMKKIKVMGFDIKLDFNGSNPDLLKKIYDQKLVDYVAMDVKCPLDKYKDVTGAKYIKSKIKRSIDMIMNSGVEYEFRTTAYPQLKLSDFKEMFSYIKGCKKYIIQEYRPDITLDNQKPLVIYGKETLTKFKEQISEEDGTIFIR